MNSQDARRLAVLIHTALAASLGVYVVLLLFVRSEMQGSATPVPPSPRLWVALAAIGIAQFAAASGVGRRLLRSRRSGSGERVRLYFLLRAAAAEAIGLFGLAAGLLGAPWTHTAVLFAIAVAAMLVSAPSRPAWQEALDRAESVDI